MRNARSDAQHKRYSLWIYGIKKTQNTDSQYFAFFYSFKIGLHFIGSGKDTAPIQAVHHATVFGREPNK
jgi:hypothetical protein